MGAQSYGCLEKEERNRKKLVLLQGTVPILHSSLLTHMTIITKVGASYVNNMNDDAPEVGTFFHGCYQALSSPRFEERAWEHTIFEPLSVSRNKG